MEQEAAAVGREDEGHLQRLGIVQRLLHAGAERQRGLLDLDDRDRLVRQVVEHDVGAPPVATGVQPAAHDDAALGEAHLLAHLAPQIPAGLLQRRNDELGADILLGQRGQVHVHAVDSP